MTTYPPDARELILSRLVSTPDVPILPTAPPSAVTPLPEWDRSTLVDHFVDALDRLKVTWEIAESQVLARLTLATRLQDEGVKQILAWTSAELPVGGVLEALDVLGIEAIAPDLFLPDTRLRPQDMDVRRKQLLALERIQVGLISATAAFAATGTLLLDSGPGRPLPVSQFPRRLLVLLPINRILPSLEYWLACAHTVSPLTTLMTGPSRSADIEMTPAYGVHGPGRLHVIMVDE